MPGISKRRIIAGALALSLGLSPALADQVQPTPLPPAAGPLTPGKPAGVKQAASRDTEVYILLGAAAVATVAGLIVFKVSSK